MTPSQLRPLYQNSNSFLPCDDGNSGTRWRFAGAARAVKNTCVGPVDPEDKDTCDAQAALHGTCQGGAEDVGVRVEEESTSLLE